MWAGRAVLAAPAQALRIGEGQRVLEEARLGEAERVVELAEAVLVCARARARPEIGRNGRGSKHPARNLKQHQRVVRKRRPALSGGRLRTPVWRR